MLQSKLARLSEILNDLGRVYYTRSAYSLDQNVSGIRTLVHVRSTVEHKATRFFHSTLRFTIICPSTTVILKRNFARSARV